MNGISYNTSDFKYLSMNILPKANILAELVCCLFLAGIISLLDEEEPQLKVGNCFCVGN